MAIQISKLNKKLLKKYLFHVKIVNYVSIINVFNSGSQGKSRTNFSSIYIFFSFYNSTSQRFNRPCLLCELCLSLIEWIRSDLGNDLLQVALIHNSNSHYIIFI